VLVKERFHLLPVELPVLHKLMIPLPDCGSISIPAKQGHQNWAEFPGCTPLQ